MSPLEIFELVAAIAGLVATIPVYHGWLRWALSWSRERRIKKLQKHKEFLSRLQSSDREFLGWLLLTLLVVVTLFSVGLMFRAVEIDPAWSKLTAVIHWVVGSAAYFVTVATLGVYSQLRSFDKTIAKLDQRIQEL